jgi:acyl-CoA reductase-like NAD-dependent aldehyde dehydrogenase
MPKASAADTDRAVKAAHRAFSEGALPAMTVGVLGKLLAKLVAHDRADLVARTQRGLAVCAA